MKNSFFDFTLFPVSESGAIPNLRKGDNAEKVLVICRAAARESELLPFLKKILGAVKLDLEKDISLLSLTAGDTISLAGIMRQEPVKKVLVFGLSPKELGLQIRVKKYQPFHLSGVDYLLTDDLNEIFKERQQGGKQLAGLLWQHLKVFFPDKL